MTEHRTTAGTAEAAEGSKPGERSKPAEGSERTDTAASAEPEQTPEQRRALFRVVRGQPDAAEVAALAAVLAATASASTASAAEGDDDRGRSFWVDRQAQLRAPLHPGAGAWKAFYLPR